MAADAATASAVRSLSASQTRINTSNLSNLSELVLCNVGVCCECCADTRLELAHQAAFASERGPTCRGTLACMRMSLYVAVCRCMGAQEPRACKFFYGGSLCFNEQNLKTQRFAL